MNINAIVFGEAGVGKTSIVNLLAGKEITRTSANSHRRAMETQRYTVPVKGKTFNIWDTTGLGEPSFILSDYLSHTGKMYTLIQQIEEQGGLHLLLFCISGGSRITQKTLHNYQLFFEVLCQKRIPIAAVVTRLEGEAKMEEWWSRNQAHVTQCGLYFSGHACITGLLRHPKAPEGRAALESLLLSCDPRGIYRMPPAFDWFSGFLERLSAIPRPGMSKDKRANLKELERLLRDRCMMDSADAWRLAEYLIHPRESAVDSDIASQLVRNLTRMQPPSNDHSVSWPLPDWLVSSLRYPFTWGATDWLNIIFGSAFPLYEDDIVVFLIGPSGSGKTMFLNAVARAPNVANVGPTPRSSSRKVNAIRCKLTDEAQIALEAEERTNIVFVDTPSFFTTKKAVKETSTWLKNSKSRSNRFGIIYLHRIDMDSSKDTLRVQRQLDTFAGTFPANFFPRAFPQRLHCVFSRADETSADHRETFRKQLNELRPKVVNGWKPSWATSIHPKLFARDDSDTAWKAVEALFCHQSD